MAIRKGEDWGEPATVAADFDVEGSDADLAAAVGANPGALIFFQHADDSDVARTIGLVDHRHGPTWVLPMDALTIGDQRVCEMAVFGTPPDRLRQWSRSIQVTVLVDGHPRYEGSATTVVVANGQYLRGHDVVPRGHPGDGKAEVQIYAVPPGERRALRSRLGTATHLPHPGITQATGRTFEIRWGRPVTLETDGVRRRPTKAATIELLHKAYRLLV